MNTPLVHPCLRKSCPIDFGLETILNQYDFRKTGSGKALVPWKCRLRILVCVSSHQFLEHFRFGTNGGVARS